MSIETKYYEKPGYLLMVASGQWTVDAVKRAIAEVREEATAKGFTRLLMDLRELLPPTDDIARFFGGEQLANFLGLPFKVAALSRPENITRFTENVAVNRGALFRVFSNRKESLRWLLEGANQLDGVDG